MIDYGVKAPTEQVIIDNLVAAKLGTITEDGFRPADGVSYVFLGHLVKEPAILDGETVVTEAVMTADVHADLRFAGAEEAKLEQRLKDHTRVAYRSDPEDGAPATKGTADGFKIFPHNLLKTPSHTYWGTE